MNLKIDNAEYLVVMEWDYKKKFKKEAISAWKNSNAKTLISDSVIYNGIKKYSLVVLYTIKNFSEIQKFLESNEFLEFREKESEYMDSDFHQSIVGLVEKVRDRKTFIPKTKYMQLRTIEVPLSDIDSYLEWRKRRIFEFVKKNEMVTSFIAFHAVFSSTPGVLFVTEFENDPDEYRESFLTPEYQEIIKEAGHEHIKSGEKGLETYEYERV
ncbi:hypothetical protein [Companilactobacillus metriopterae]|uniref:hypothetical protein n=1 Tax=Companilactobacillus metriopterae TaxID=1909267 RepID=UPI00100B1A0F|nr:hypothetical protein [Companilactobacillus metriopterae]